MALLEIQGLKTHFQTDDGWLHAVDGVDMSIDLSLIHISEPTRPY